MNITARIPQALVACALLSVLFAANARAAAPVTVNLRVEGSSSTLLEGSVTTGPATFQTSSSGGPHPCDYVGNGGVGGESVGPVGGPTTALRDAALAAGLPFDAEWFGALEGKPGGDFFVSQVGPDHNESSPPFDSWGFAVDYTSSEVGGCEVALAPGSEVLWAYNFFNLGHLLRLTGPAVLETGHTFTVHVADGHSGEALSGALLGQQVGGVPTPLAGAPATDAAGNVTLSLTKPGAYVLKATRSDSVRSNALRVCVHDAADGGCGSGVPKPVLVGAAPPPPYKGPYALVAALSSIRDGQVFRHGHGPRRLDGQIRAHNAVTSVSLELRRRRGGRCSSYDGARARFVALRCGVGRPFKVSSSGSFSYLLPAALGPGRYVLDVTAGDVAGNTVALARGTSRMVFYVR
jgi:hypothetical protein